MGKNQALIIGVSHYTLPGTPELPFCKNDIFTVRDAFTSGLNVDPSNIMLCGTSGTVSSSDIINSLKHLSVVSEADDSLLLYFSGHGTTINSEHYLVLSDSLLKTHDLIHYLEVNRAKNKVLFLDCCMAGNFSIGSSAVFDIQETADEFAGKGYAVLASCNATQFSYGHPDKPVSLFTSFLCQALMHPFIIREGKKSLNDIHKLLLMLLEIWNKKNPAQIQTPVFRAKLGGTVYFKIHDYHSYPIKAYFSDHERYTIYSVKPSHSSIAKRYSIQAILKHPMSLSEIANINNEIVEEVKMLDIFSNLNEEKRWKSKPANLIFCYFGLDESDILNTNYLCHTTWADDSQDKKWWYRKNNNSEVINNIHFDISTYYQSAKAFIIVHTGEKETLISETCTIISAMITYAEQVISMFNEYLNCEITEEVFKYRISSVCAELNRLYFAETDLPIPPDELKTWSQACTNLASGIHDFTLYYGENCFASRTSENRKACMEFSIKQYYRNLEAFKAIDSATRSTNNSHH